MSNRDQSEEFYSQWVSSLPPEHQPTALDNSGLSESRLSELARQHWGDLSDEFNGAAIEAKQNGWVDGNGQLTEAGKIELTNRSKDKADEIKEIRAVEVAEGKKDKRQREALQKYVDAGTPQSRAEALLEKYGLDDGAHTVAVGHKGNNGYVLKLVHLDKAGATVEKEFKRQELDQVLQLLEKYLQFVTGKTGKES